MIWSARNVSGELEEQQALGFVRESWLRSSPAWAAAAYAAMVLFAGGFFFLVSGYGEHLSAPAAADAASRLPASSQSLATLEKLLVTLTAVVVVGSGLGRLAGRIGQPPVLGQVIGGVLLGPSLLGAISPAAYQFVLPPDVVPYLNIVAQLGVVFYMFIVGVELNPGLMRGQMHATVATSHASIIVPFVLGTALALFLYPRFGSADVPFTNFALFMGVAMSITAFPVLARILSDLKMNRSEVGVVALTCAAIDDVTAWCLLALAVGFVEANVGNAFVAAGLTLLFIGFMFIVVRPLMQRMFGAGASGAVEPGAGQLALVVAGVMVSALITDAIGVHALFGAFLFGAVIPHDSRLGAVITERFDGFVTTLLLPAFFALAGMRTEIGLLSGWSAWLACGLIIAVASLGKIGGASIAARAGGFTWRAAAALGVLMNTRGLMQLIVLNVGLELGVVTPTLFTMMVLMALVTTTATTPLLRLLLKDEMGAMAANARLVPSLATPEKLGG
jgi:Kef-type K+ transport system membrane component KefB